MGFMTLITIYLPVEMNSKHQCITSHMLLFINVTKLNKKQNIYFCYLILTLQSSIEKCDNTDLDHFTSKPLIWY